MSADPIKAVRSVLLDDDATAALVSTRIYGGEVPEDVEGMPQAAIVLKPAGGFVNPGGGFQKYGKSRLDIFCYGKTLNEAWAVYLAVYTALKQMRSQHAENVLLHSIDVVSKGTVARDPVTQWPLALSTFSVLAAEVASA